MTPTPTPVSSGEVPSRYVAVTEARYPARGGRRLAGVYHTATARVFLVDTGTAEVLTGARDPAELDPALRAQLRQRGLLVQAGTDETGPVRAAAKPEARRTRQFVIMPTAYCNMGCHYCGQEHLRGPVAVAGRGHRAALVARVGRAAASGRYDELRVRWFGGEPLLGYAALRDLSGQFVAEAERHRVRYTALLVTNGVLLDGRKLRELHRRCRVEQIEVTLDGPAAAHERGRPLKNGHGSYHRIVAALQQAVSDPDLSELRLSVRTNVGTHNVAEATAFAAAMRDAGLAHPRITFYPAPVHPWGEQVPDQAVAARELAEAELAWYEAYLAAGLTCSPLPVAPRPNVCVATDRHSEVVAPDGRIYSCTEQPLVPGQTEQSLADLAELPADQLRPAGAYDDWYDTLPEGRTGCRDCRLLPLCGGACPKLWRQGRPPCPPLKWNLNERLDLYVRARAGVAA